MKYYKSKLRIFYLITFLQVVVILKILILYILNLPKNLAPTIPLYSNNFGNSFSLYPKKPVQNLLRTEETERKYPFYILPKFYWYYQIFTSLKLSKHTQWALSSRTLHNSLAVEGFT